ncbi:signal peptide peptidase SppA [bacterium]|nr:signal peptide peptidase SppA [bacterium]
MEETTQPQVVHIVHKSSVWRKFWIILAVLTLLCSLCSVLPMALLLLIDSSEASKNANSDELTYTFVGGKKSSDNKLLAIYIDQPILTASQDYSDNLFSTLFSDQYIYGYHIKDELMKATEDEKIKGVLLIINSPGGTVVGARAISDGVDYFSKQTGKPVYAYVQDLAASGSYWAAAAADKIYAEQGSLIGSIGVIMGPFEYYDKLVTLDGVGAANGITITYITGGKYKDLGNPTRKISDEEMKVLQEGIDSEYTVFVDHVSEKRNIPTPVIRENIKALVYGAQKAKSFGLIDEIGTREIVLEALSDKAGIGDDYQLVKFGTNTTLFGSIFASLKHGTTQKTEAPARVCKLCGKSLYFYGNPLDY